MNDKETIIAPDGRVFVKVCRSSDLFEKRGKRIFFPGDEDFQVAIFRVGGRVYCLGNICPHRHQARMHEGILRGLNVICPLHGWTYSLETGENVNRKQGLKGLDKYDSIEVDEFIYIEKPRFKPPKWRADSGCECHSE